MTKMIKLLHCSISSFTIRKTTSYYEMISFKAVTLRLEVFVTESSYFDGLYSKVLGPIKTVFILKQNEILKIAYTNPALRKPKEKPGILSA